MCGSTAGSRTDWVAVFVLYVHVSLHIKLGYRGMDHSTNGTHRVLLFLIFFPTAPDTDLSSSTASLTKSPPPKRRDAVIVGVSMLVTLLVVGLASITMIAAFPSKTQAWANLLGSVAGTLAMIQYVPQIYFTWRRGNIGSLSIITMLIQVPGSFLFAFSLWLRVGWVGWATWLVYIVTGTLQGILLGLAIMYFFAGRKAAADRISVASEDEDEGATAEEREQATERTALLSNGHSAPSKTLPVRGETQRTSSGQNRQLSMLYAATPPDQDSESSSGNHRK